MTQELIFIFFSIFTFSLISFYFGISTYFLSAAIFVHYYPNDQILASLSLLSILSAILIGIQYFKKEYLNKDFFSIFLWLLLGLILNKLVSEQIILLNIYKYRINFKLRCTDILVPIILITALILRKNLRYVLIFMSGFTPISGIYYVVYNLFRNKKIEDKDLFIAQTIIFSSLITNNYYLSKPSNFYIPELKIQNLVASFAIIMGVYVSIKLRGFMPLSIYKYISVLILLILSIGTIASNLFF